MNTFLSPEQVEPGTQNFSVCDREPIHVPGAIQPHGLLLVIAPADRRVIQVAGDTDRLLNLSRQELLGRPLSDLPGGAALMELTPEDAESGPARPTEVVRLNDRPFDVMLRLSEAGLVVELEPTGLPGPTRRSQPLPLVQTMMARLQGLATPDAFYQAAVEEVRAITGFDRVMLYRFLPDESGAVVAEAHAEGIGSYLDLHYPASDIPRQARELYLRNWLRLIPDAEYTPAPLHPPVSPITGRLLDMGACALRSVSPVHVAYLRNMGVRASMSLSVVRRGKLWGLIACHHRTPWHVPPVMRTACELFAQMFSLQLEAIEQRESHAYGLQLRGVHEQLVRAMAGEEDLAQGLIRNRPNLMDYVKAEGVALWIDSRYSAGGATPSEDQVRALAAWLRERSEGSGVIAIDRLPELYPPARDFAKVASGVLAISVSREPHDFILWFRPEVVRTVTWAGNPNKPVDLADGGAGLSPRSSFAAWVQEVHHHSRPWQEVEIEAAQTLHVSLLEVVLRRIDQVQGERDKARGQQELLMAELDHRVKNTLANIQALVRRTRSGADDLEGFVHDFDRRIRAMAAAHSLLSSSRWESAGLRALIEEELRPYRIANAEGRTSVTGQDLRLKPKAALAISLAVHELATNAAKYGALSVASGRVSVTCKVVGGEALLEWVEIDGPPVRPPTRRGFGSTVVERGLSYELGGRAVLQFEPSGLRCTVHIPLGHLAEAAGDIAPAPPASVNPVQGGRLDGVRVLVAEDVALVALDVAETLQARGASVVGPVASMPAAVRLAVSSAIDAALLDVDLGGEPSFAVADVLSERRIPFLFTTGFSASAILPSRFQDVPVLTKPCDGEELSDALANLLSARGG